MARQNILLNAYFDLGQYGPMSPYVGVGIGASVFQTSSTTTAYFADTKQAIGNYGVGQNIISPIANVGPTGSTIGYYSLDAAQARTSYNLAMALHAGLSYDLGSSTSLDVGYRYLHSGNYVPLAGASSATTAGVASHQIHVGLRFLLQ
jgi:opacity protein-like surface antigen